MVRIIPPTQWLSDPPWNVSICFKLFPISGVDMKRSFSNDVSIGKCDFWCFTSSFFFVTQSSRISFSMMWFFDQCWYHVHFWRFWYLGDLVLVLLGRCNQRLYQIIGLVFQIKPWSVFPWWYNLFLLQGWIYIFDKYSIKHSD